MGNLKEAEICASFCDGIIENNELWVFDNSLQSVCKIDMDTYEIDIVSVFLQEDVFNVMWMFSFAQELFLISYHSDYILVFDKITLKYSISRNIMDEAVCEATYSFKDGENIWFVPYYSSGKLSSFNMRNKKWKYETNTFEKVISKKNENNRRAIVYPHVENGILCFSLFENKIMKYHFSNDRTEEVINYEGVYAVCFDGNTVWFTKKMDGNIYYFQNNKIEVIRFKEKQTFSFLYNTDKYIIALPGTSENVVFIEKKNLMVHVIKLPLTDFEKEKEEKIENANILNFNEDKNNYYFYPNWLKHLYIINKVTKQAIRVELKKKNSKNFLIYELMYRNQIFLEQEEPIEMLDYIELIKQSKKIPSEKDKDTHGDEIYQKMKIEN